VSKTSASTRRTLALCSVSVIVILSVALVILSPAHRNSDSAKAFASPLNPSSILSRSSAITPGAHERMQATFAALPLAFEQNQGQTDPQVKYMARGRGYALFLTSNNAVFAFHPKASSDLALRRRLPRKIASAERHDALSSVVRMDLVNANSKPSVIGSEPLPGKSNYYLGNNQKNWHTNVPQFGRVSYRDVYPGVNLAYYGQQSKLEFDFIVAPNSNPSPIELSFSGAQHVKADSDGNLVVSSKNGEVLLHKPVAYQIQNGNRQEVNARFALNARNEVRFELGAYDRSRELVIDPTLTYASYLGGASEDEVFGITVDSANNIYVTGETNSTSGWPSVTGVPSNHEFDIFVTKVSSAGALSYTTFVGGTLNDSGLAIAVDSSHAAYVTGITQSTDFPTTSGAPQATGGGGGNCTNTKAVNAPCTDAFAVKLSSTGTMSWATYMGGTNDDDGYAIAVDSNGNTWVGGDTFSGDFVPIGTASAKLNVNFNLGGALSPPADDGFVVEINPTGTAPFLYATYLGGSFGDQINGIAIDKSNNVYVAGETNSTDFPVTPTAFQKICGSDSLCNATSSTSYYDAFVTKIAAGGASLSYSTYIGGSSDDYAFAIALDSSGDAYVTGETSNDDTTTSPAVPYPTTSGAFSTKYNAAATSNAFVTELNPTGTALTYSTFLGGSTADFGGGIAVDSFGDAYLTGETSSADFPVTSNAVQTQINGNGSTANSDAFVTQVLAGGSKLGFSSFLGGSLDENANASGSVGTIALDSSNNMWLGGSTDSTDFPVTKSTAAEPSYGGNPYDGFVAEVSSATVADFNISASAPTAVAAGSSGSSTVTLSALFGYTSPVSLSCTVAGSGSPLPACGASSFATNPVTPTTAGVTSTLTITTTGPTAALAHPSKFLFATWLPIAGLSLVGVGFSSARTRKRKLFGFLMIGLMLAALFLMPACGGGSGSGGGGGGGTGGTPAGAYTVTITGTGTDSAATTHSTTVTLTVN
jgi:hypothetical protein